MKSSLLVLCALALLAPPVWAGDTIHNGVDVWHTAAGPTFMDFAYEPIPAGFFCSGSAPFTGRVTFRGVPIATAPAGALGNADTVIRRLDDAVFDGRGVATTRLRVEALSLEGIEPVLTTCGTWQLRATLAPGEQPLTEMRIVRDRKTGGHYEAPLLFAVRLSFARVDVPTGETLTLDRQISLRPVAGALWTSKPPKDERAVRIVGYVRVDTDGDLEPDLSVPGTSDFFPAGRRDPQLKRAAYTICDEQVGMLCHDSGIAGECHCTEIAAQ